MSLGVASFDELNRLVGMNRSEPFDEYFEPMKLTTEQKRERKRLAEALESEFVYMLSYMFYAYPTITAEMADELRDRYINALIEVGIVAGEAVILTGGYIEYYQQAQKFAIDAVAATQRHQDDPYYYSEDRARLCSEDQANFIGDIKDFKEASENGYMFKTWETAGDNRVRDTHAEVEGLTIPIDEPFVLAGGMLNHPHDSSLGADPSEISGCRCSLSFSYGE